jgi:hypothetical protein
MKPFCDEETNKIINGLREGNYPQEHINRQKKALRLEIAAQFISSFISNPNFEKPEASLAKDALILADELMKANEEMPV